MHLYETSGNGLIFHETTIYHSNNLITTNTSHISSLYKGLYPHHPESCKKKIPKLTNGNYLVNAILDLVY